MIILFLILTLFYAATNLILGFSLLRFCFGKKLDQYPDILILTTGFLLGEGIFASLWMVLGSARQFKLAIIWAILILVNIIGLKFWRHALKLIKKIFFEYKLAVGTLSSVWRIIVCLLLVLILFFALGSFILPPMSDGEAFNLVLAKIMAYTGALQPPHDYFLYSQIGLFGEMHFAAISSLASADTARFFSFLTSLAIAGLLLGLAKLTKVKIMGQLIAVVILFTSSVITNHITDGKIDVFPAALGLCAYVWATQSKDKNWLAMIMTGIFAGWAIIAKLPEVLILPGICLLIGWNFFDEVKTGKDSCVKIWQKYILTLVLIIPIVLLAFAPQIVKNKVLYNQPFATYFNLGNNNSLTWAVPAWSGTESSNVVIQQSLVKPTGTSVILFQSRMFVVCQTVRNLISNLLFSPLLFTFWEYPIKGDNLSILVLAFLPFLFFWKPANSIQKRLLIVSLLAIIIWIILRSTAIQPRYIISTLLIFVFIVAAAVENLLERENLWLLKKIVPIGIVIVLLVCLSAQFYLKFGQIVSNRLNPIPLQGPHYQSLQFVNNIAKSTDRVYLAGSYAYFLRADLLSTINSPITEIVDTSDGSPWQRLYNEGFNYVVIQHDSTYEMVTLLENSYPSNNLLVKKIYSDYNSDVYVFIKPAN